MGLPARNISAATDTAPLRREAKKRFAYLVP
jgi:hypothetical protein